jgi:hypothetical protein
MDDATKPLRSRLLAVPALRERYLRNIAELASKSLNWERLGPRIAQHRELIEDELRQDTRMAVPIEAFEAATSSELPPPASASPTGEPGRAPRSLRAFFERRAAFLLAHPEVTKAAQGP